jgi:hypothetical protein
LSAKYTISTRIIKEKILALNFKEEPQKDGINKTIKNNLFAFPEK